MRRTNPHNMDFPVERGFFLLLNICVVLGTLNWCLRPELLRVPQPDWATLSFKSILTSRSSLISVKGTAGIDSVAEMNGFVFWKNRNLSKIK